ncbi:MAG: bifunctional UDP-N-acetylglucosamine diphosphorylase/glucosamine-1-phosphate N-acetyltransferase GlmU, partial [Patescibacteria group bacterium]
FMCFDKKWLFENIDKLQDDNKAHEFYLTDMIKIAFLQNHQIETLAINPQEAMGINSPKELEIASNLKSL